MAYSIEKFGEKIRAFRERRSLTLREVADRAGVSESLVSQIERNRVSPALDTLLALAEALDMDLEYLFADYRRARPVQITRSHERFSFTKPGVRYERLAQLEVPDHLGGIEAYCITLEPGAQTGSTEYGHQGWELGMVEAGKGTLSLGNHTYELAWGDSISFRSDAPHVLANAGTEPLRVLWIISPPKGVLGKAYGNLNPQQQHEINKGGVYG
ncbi:MAG: XRE family transcriptional regulator [Treponema sp.]|jgi:transcriptional regulator with XRE-family HTH domain|nr:XRE family transcriptional regulator [Treponema sp.]